MKHPLQDNEVQRLHDQFRLRIDTAVKAVAEALQVAADLFLAVACQNLDKSRDKSNDPHVSEMMTSNQAADYLGVKTQTLDVWRCTKRYPLPFVKVGRKVRYRRGDLDKFLQRRTENRGHEDES